MIKRSLPLEHMQTKWVPRRSSSGFDLQLHRRRRICGIAIPSRSIPTMAPDLTYSSSGYILLIVFTVYLVYNVTMYCYHCRIVFETVVSYLLYILYSSCYTMKIYFEQQESALCGQHCLNACLHCLSTL